MVLSRGHGTRGRDHGQENNEADLATMVANLQRQLEAQEREIQQLQGQQNNPNANGEGIAQANPPIQPHGWQA